MYSVKRIESDDWQVLKELRLAALQESPQWFSGDFAQESAQEKIQWIEVLNRDMWFALRDEEMPIGLMAISDRESDRGTDCWLFSCWIAPPYRRQGLLHLLMNRFDDECRIHGWKVQGLGVWPNNAIAIDAYERMGFEKSGEPRPSRSRPSQLYQMMRRTLPQG